MRGSAIGLTYWSKVLVKSPFSRGKYMTIKVEPSHFLQRVSILLLVCGLFLSVSAAADVVNKNKVTASYLYNFSRNILWPNEATKSSFNMAIYGSDNQGVYVELAALQDKLRLRRLPVRVTHLNSIKAMSDYDLVYVGRVSNAVLADIYSAIEGRAILVVTEGNLMKQWVMIDLTQTKDGRMQFEVNNSNIINHGLKPLPELILNGGSEIDVAKLYREGQASLVSLQKQLGAREKLLHELSGTIQSQESLNENLRQELKQLNANIRQSDSLIAQQNTELEEQRERIIRSNGERARLQQEVDVRTRELDVQQVQLTEIGAAIDKRERRLSELNDTIALQEREIDQQKNAIFGLDETVDAQQTVLRYLWGLVLLGLLLLITIFAAYIMKQRANKRLAEHSQELQLAKDRLAIAKRKAEAASQAKSDFLSLMSHELRTPLQSIIGYSEVVMEELKSQDDDEHVQDLMRVINNAERLLRLINGVLDMAKIESGHMGLDLTEVKLSSLVDEALDNLRPLFERNAIKLSVAVKDGPHLPTADPEKLVHILINLLGNACKFAHGGEVSVSAEHLPNLIELRVSDTGIGLSEQQQRQIFDPFLQVDSSSTRKFQGSGLGLSISRHFCEMMGGNIRVESQLGAGATFIVELPLPIVPKRSALNASDPHDRFTKSINTKNDAC